MECAVLFCSDLSVPRFLRFGFVRLERALYLLCFDTGGWYLILSVLMDVSFAFWRCKAHTPLFLLLFGFASVRRLAE
jgi:hypothetical protein